MKRLLNIFSYMVLHFRGNYNLYYYSKMWNSQRYLNRSLMTDKHLLGLIKKILLAAVKTLCHCIHAGVLRAKDKEELLWGQVKGFGSVQTSSQPVPSRRHGARNNLSNLCWDKLGHTLVLYQPWPLNWASCFRYLLHQPITNSPSLSQKVSLRWNQAPTIRTGLPSSSWVKINLYHSMTYQENSPN